jgi:hypothetical protein
MAQQTSQQNIPVTGTGGVEQQQGHQQMGRGTTSQVTSFEDVLTDEMRLALHDAVQAANVCEWCADECIGEGSPHMSECIRLCRDVADLASLNVTFLSRGSLVGPEVAEAFAIAAEECARECARHSHSHCQECASTLQRAADTTWKLLSAMEGQQQQQHATQGGI